MGVLWKILGKESRQITNGSDGASAARERLETITKEEIQNSRTGHSEYITNIKYIFFVKLGHLKRGRRRPIGADAKKDETSWFTWHIFNYVERHYPIGTIPIGKMLPNREKLLNW